jgi:pimeloyl-ACP methyl ester carboxylesterase
VPLREAATNGAHHQVRRREQRPGERDKSRNRDEGDHRERDQREGRDDQEEQHRAQKDAAGLVYACGFAPEPGEHCFQLAAMFPGSMLGPETSRPVPRSDGTTDLYVAPDSFHGIFCQDVPAPQAARMAVTQRPATQEALTEPSGERPLWRDVPSRFVIGEEDHIIPAALQHYMAERAGSHRTLEIPGGSHAITVSHPEAVAHQILDAAAVPAAA